MQIKKMSKIGLAFAFAILLAFACLTTILCTSASEQKMNASAAVSSVTVNFAGFPSTIDKYCVVSLYDVNGTPLVSSIVAPGSANSGTFNLASKAGKLEITVPMYCAVSGLTGAYNVGSTYYVDITSSTTLSSITVTYTDRGYLGGSVIA